MKRNYTNNGTRLTDCCGAYATFHDTTLCCKVCWKEVPDGQGDGTETLEQQVRDFMATEPTNDEIEEFYCTHVSKYTKDSITEILTN